MKRNKLSALFVLLVALLFLLPSAAALGSTSGESGDTEPEAENSVPLGEEMETEYSEAGEDPEIPDPVNELTENSYLVPYGEQITHPVKPVGPGNGPDTSVETKSSVMVISKIGLHDEDGFPVDELDDGEEGKVSAEVTNEGGKEDVMTDVEVDFYYIDKDEDTYYIDGANIEYIEGDGNSSTAMVNWTADMLARTIKVIADADGSDGGPSEGYQDVNITQANYAQKIYCPYPAGSGKKSDTLDYWIKVDNIGKKTDDVKLEVEGAGVWIVKFDNGQSTKTIYNMKSEEHKWEKVSVTIPNGAGGDAYKDITIKATSQSNTDKVRTFDLRTTVLRSDTPILILDRDHGSQPQPYWNDASRYWAQALDDGGYTGMHYRTTSSVSDTKDYDIIMLSAGYDWQYGLTSTDETNLIAFLKDGGSVWIGGGLFMQASDEPSYGKTVVHPLYHTYMNASWQAQNRHPPRPLIGVAGDPIGKGMVYSMNYIWTVGQDWGESVWPNENDDWTHGIYHHGDVYCGIRHHWQGSTIDKPEEYRSVYTGIDLCQVGDDYPMSSSGYWGDPDRTDVMYNIATWLGVAPPLPKANDLALEKIIDPAGDYIYPGDAITINVEVANYGIKDYETSYTVTVDIEQTNGGYSTTLTKPMDASDNPIPARGWAYPGAQIVSLDWTVPTEEDAEYKFTAKVGSDDNNDNNEKVATATAKKVEDMRTIKCEWEWRTHYWLTAVKDTPIRFDLEVENIGARSATFTAYVNILDPWESGILAKLEKEVKVGAGHTKTVHFVWTPDKAAGCRDATQSWRVSYTDDGLPYWIDVGVDYDDDDTGNNEIEHSYGSGYSNCVGDITVVDWYESGEAGAHGWDLGDPWHWTPMFTMGGEYGTWHGNKTSVEEGSPYYDDNTKGIMTSPVLDLGQYSAVRSDFLYVCRMQNPDYVSIQIKKEDEPDYWKDAPHNYEANWSRDRGNGGYLNNGNNYNDYAGHKTRTRWCFKSDEANHIRGFTWDIFILMATADNYFDKDLILDNIAVDPLVEDIEQDRKIKVTVKNIGEVVPNSSFRVWCNVTDDQGEQQDVCVKDTANKRNYQDVPQNNSFEKGTTQTVYWTWTPEEYGIYDIECSVEWDQDEFPGNNMLETVGLVQYYFFFDEMEEGNPKKPEYDPWITGTEDTNGKGGDRATDDWEEGEPTYGPTGSYSGTKCWGTNLAGDYSNNSKDSSYLSVHVDLRTAKQPYLIFAHWLEIEAQGYDTAYVEIQEVDEDRWHQLWQNPEPEKRHYATRGWVMVNISLEDWQLKDINLRFRFMSDSDVVYPGWYIDDVGISGITPPEYDARIDKIEVTPFYGGNIPPGESIIIDTTISNIGIRDSGKSHKITVSGKVYKVVGENKNKIADLAAQEIQINSGQRGVVSLKKADGDNYKLPTGDGVKYEIEISVAYPGDEFPGNNVDSIILWGRKLHDAGIIRLYVTPTLEDAGYPRVATAVVKSHSNIPEDFSIDFRARYQDETEVIDSGSVPISLEVGETKEVSWNWTAYTYGFYDVEAEVDLTDEEGNNLDTNTDPGHENILTVEVATVEKIFSDTVDNPVVSGGEYYDTYWTGLVSSDSTAGWHKEDSIGYLSRKCYYVGRTTDRGRSYVGSMNVSLISDPIDLSDVTSATLRWYTMFHVEGGVYDNLVVYFSADNGTEWVEQTRYPGNNYRNSSQYPVNDNGWLMMEKELRDKYYTNEFRIRLRFVSDRAINYEGIYLDDISIYVTGTLANHAPVAQFTAQWIQDAEVRGTAYSERLINRPMPEFEEIRGNPAFNNLPNPEAGKQGGLGFNAIDKVSDTISFDASYSYEPDREDKSISYVWDFGDDTTGYGETVDHQYTEIPLEKFYRVTLTVKDDDGDSTKDYLYVWLGNSPPRVRFNITDSLDISHILNDEFGAEVFYRDTLKLIPDVVDPENDRIISYEWVFEVNETGKKPQTTKASDDVVDFTVGVDHLYSIVDEGKPEMPSYNTNPVHYTITLTAMDENDNEGSYTLNVLVYPYAQETFTKKVEFGATFLYAEVTLVWRGKPDEAALDINRITPERPVFVHIDKTASPDPTLSNKGGIGHVYDIRAVGVYLQNGEEGFIEAEISLPVLPSELEDIGDKYALQDDLMLEHYDKMQKRFYAVEGSHVIKEIGKSYVVGTVDQFSLFTAIVDSIYNTSNPNYYNVLPNLAVCHKKGGKWEPNIEFSRSPVQNRQEVEVRVQVKNTGKIHARNVDVKIYDGDTLIGDQRIDVVKAGGGVVIVKEIFNVSMLDPTQQKETHRIKVFVNKQHAINEGPMDSPNYDNNKAEKPLVVTALQRSTPSFESSSMMMVVSVAMVALASMMAMKLRRKKEEE